MLSYKEFLNENKSAFNDIVYRDNLGRSLFNTRDNFTIDFIHMTDPYYIRDEESLNKYLIKFNHFYKTNINLNQLKKCMFYLEKYWNDESDLTLDQVLFFINNPDKIKDFFKSKDVINKYQL